MADRNDRRTGWAAALVTAISLGAFLALVLPFQTYLANTSNYEFPFARLALQQLVAGVGLTLAFFALFWLSDRWLRGWLQALFVAALVALYLESGVLSVGLPEIDGNLSPMFDSAARKLWDAAVIVAVFVAFLTTRRLTRGWIHWVAAGVLVMGLASLADVGGDEMSEATVESVPGMRGNFILNSDVLDKLEYSPTRNVLVLVADSVTATDVAEILDADPALASHFPGFTLYPGNLGVLEGTSRGVPSLLTGRLPEPGGSLARFSVSVFEPGSLLRDFDAHGDAMYCMLDLFPYGYTTAAAEKRMPLKPSEGLPVVFWHSRDVPYMSVMSVVEFRIIPFAFKGKYLYAKMHSRRANGEKLYVHEHLMYPKIGARPVSDDPRQTFAFLHSYGSHLPFVFDADGNRVTGGKKGYPMMREAVSNVVVSLSRLMDTYRERGIYDRSFIVLCSDHGSDFAKCREGSHPRASALLMVKGDGWDGDLRTSDAATTHLNVTALVRAAREKSPTREESDRILSAERRTLRIYDKHRKTYTDYVHRPDGSVEEVKTW